MLRKYLGWNYIIHHLAEIDTTQNRNKLTWTRCLSCQQITLPSGGWLTDSSSVLPVLTERAATISCFSSPSPSTSSLPFLLRRRTFFTTLRFMFIVILTPLPSNYLHFMPVAKYFPRSLFEYLPRGRQYVIFRAWNTGVRPVYSLHAFGDWLHGQIFLSDGSYFLHDFIAPSLQDIKTEQPRDIFVGQITNNNRYRVAGDPNVNSSWAARQGTAAWRRCPLVTAAPLPGLRARQLSLFWKLCDLVYNINNIKLAAGRADLLYLLHWLHCTGSAGPGPRAAELQTQTKVPEDYTKFYNNREGPY